jgi:hypothetical protein
MDAEETPAVSILVLISGAVRNRIRFSSLHIVSTIVPKVSRGEHEGMSCSKMPEPSPPVYTLAEGMY